MNGLKMFDLSGKVAVITGAGNGLGYQIAEAMAEAGADVVCADIDMARNDATAARVEALGRKARSIKCDVTREADVASLFQSAEKAFGHVDIAFANAGMADLAPQPLHDYPTDNWNAVIAVNLQGVFYTDREALKIMLRQQSGKLINVASMWGLAGASSVAPIPAYNAAKGAVVNLTRELALEYATQNIQVNAICPASFARAWQRAPMTTRNLSPRSPRSRRWAAWPTPAKSRARRSTSRRTHRVSRPA